MTSADGNRSGFRDGLESSQGNPLVLAILNAVLSLVFAWLIIWGSDIIGIADFTLTNIAIVAIGVFILTYIITRP